MKKIWLIPLALLVFLGVTYFILVKLGYIAADWNEKGTARLPNSETRYAEGVLVVSFKPTVTEQEALAVLNTYELQPFSPERFFRYDYVAISTINGDSIEPYVSQIKAFPFVKGCTEKPSQRGKGCTFVFNWPATKEEIMSLKTIAGITFDEPALNDRMELIKVPKKRELEFKDMLGKEEKISSVSLNFNFNFQIN